MSLYRQSNKSFSGTWRSILNITLFLLIIIIIAGFIGYQIFHFVNRTDAEKMLRQQQPFAILLVGELPDKENNKSDPFFISLASIHPATSRVGFISFFPDMRLTDDEAPLNERIAYTDINEVISDLSNILSLDIPYYLRFEPEDVSRLIDLIEGIPYFLRESDLIKGELLPRGEFVLDGSLVEPLILPETDSEFAPALKLFRQYSLMLNMWRVKQKKWQILSDPEIFSAAAEIDSNLSEAELYQFGDDFLSHDKWLPLFTEIPVKREKDKFIMDAEATALYLKSFKRKLSQKENPFLELPPKMEVKNGTRVANLAKSMRSRLTRKGIQVLEFANAARHDYKQTILLDRSARVHYLDTVARILGIEKYYHSVNRAQFTDLVLILGDNYRELKFEQQ